MGLDLQELCLPGWGAELCSKDVEKPMEMGERCFQLPGGKCKKEGPGPRAHRVGHGEGRREVSRTRPKALTWGLHCTDLGTRQRRPQKGMSAEARSRMLRLD